jgi:hypothetical protein
MHSKAVVTKPQNVFVLRDIMMNGYIGGCGTQWFPHGSASEFMNVLNKRLGLDEHYMMDPKGVASMIALPCSWGLHMHDVVGMSDRILPWTVSQNAEAQYSHFPGGKVAWMILYNRGFDFTSVHYGEDQRGEKSTRCIRADSTQLSKRSPLVLCVCSHPGPGVPLERLAQQLDVLPGPAPPLERARPRRIPARARYVGPNAM